MSSSTAMVKFAKCEGFMQTLRERVDGHFTSQQISKRDIPAMYLKTLVILSWFAASYVGLVFFASTWPVALFLSVSLGVSMAAIGFNIQHDGGHGAYSDSRLVNHVMAFTLDMLGGSSFIWKRTHNVIHHSYTNVTGVDGDIDLGFLGRLSPHQPRYWFHRFQHFYLWFLYGFITIKWQFRDDFQALFTGRIHGTDVPRPNALELTQLIVGKLLFLTLAFGVPHCFHAWYYVALWFFVASFAQGVLLSIVFQLAHCVQEATFPMPDDASHRIENAWAVHQVETTVDFARTSRIVNWLTGGLNYQIEHHLFPQICHVHYPAIAGIVERTSAEFGVHYYAHQTLWQAVRSHYTWLRQMGRPDHSVAAATAAAA